MHLYSWMMTLIDIFRSFKKRSKCWPDKISSHRNLLFVRFQEWQKWFWRFLRIKQLNPTLKKLMNGSNSRLRFEPFDSLLFLSFKDLSHQLSRKKQTLGKYAMLWSKLKSVLHMSCTTFSCTCIKQITVCHSCLRVKLTACNCKLFAFLKKAFAC